MVRLDKKKTREKGVPVVDFQYVFFGRHKGNNAVKYLTVFVFLIILVSVAAFWLQAPAATYNPQQNNQQTQQQAEGVFVPAPSGKYAPKLININNAPAWEYSLPEGTWVAAADNGNSHFVFDYGDRVVVPSIDGKWMLSYSTKNSPEKNSLNNGQKILTGTRLFVAGSEKVGQSESSNFIFQVVKITPECKSDCYVDPQEYFNSLK